MADAVHSESRSIVLLVEDDPVLGEITEAKLHQAGFAVQRVRTAEEGLVLLRSGQTIHAVFSDIVLPGDMSGLQLARTVAAEFPATPVLLTTGFSSAFDVAQVRGLETIAKPYDYTEVTARLTQLIARFRSS